MKNRFFLLISIFWGGTMTASAMDISYTFTGNRWGDQRHHWVSTTAESSADGHLRANLIVQNHRNPELPWSVNFTVTLHDHFVFDGSLYRVTSITVDHVVRERIRKAMERKTTLAPGSAEIRDIVVVTKVANAAFDEGQIVLPITPSILHFSISPREELEVIFDGAVMVNAQKRVARMRWRILKEYDDLDTTPAEVAYKIVDAEQGMLIDISGLARLKVDDIMAASPHHQTWLVLSVLRNPRQTKWDSKVPLR